MSLPPAGRRVQWMNTAHQGTVIKATMESILVKWDDGVENTFIRSDMPRIVVLPETKATP